MKNLLKVLADVLSVLRSEKTRRDPLTDFNARDWADLPTYHPLVDSDPKARC